MNRVIRRVVLAVLVVICMAFVIWLYLSTTRTARVVPQQLHDGDSFEAMMQVVENDQAAFDDRMFALQRAIGLNDVSSNNLDTIRVATAGLELVGNPRYRRSMRNNARRRGHDPDQNIQALRDISYTMRGAALSELGRYEEAIADLQKVTEAARNRRAWRKSVGVAAFYTHRYALAADTLSALLAMDDGDIFDYNMLAYSQLNLGQQEAALSNFLHVIDRDSSETGAFLYAAAIMATSQDEALRDGVRALELLEGARLLKDQPSPFFYDMKACAFAELGQFDRALDSAHNALDLLDHEYADDESFELTRDAILNRIESFQQGMAWRE